MAKLFAVHILKKSTLFHVAKCEYSNLNMYAFTSLCVFRIQSILSNGKVGIEKENFEEKGEISE
jgi:hypothetical protein